MSYDKYFGDETVKITINGITAFNKLTTYAVSNVGSGIKNNIFVFIGVLVGIFILIVFFRIK